MSWYIMSCHISSWLDASNMEVRYVGAGSSLDEDQVEERGLDKFSLRACIQPESAMGPLLWLAVFPLGKEDLVEKRPQDYWTRKCPRIHLGMGPKGAVGQRSWGIEMTCYMSSPM